MPVQVFYSNSRDTALISDYFDSTTSESPVAETKNNISSWKIAKQSISPGASWAFPGPLDAIDTVIYSSGDSLPALVPWARSDDVGYLYLYPAPAPSPPPSPPPAPAPAPSPPAPTPPPSSQTNVEVNFNVLVDADSSVTVLGESAPVVSNVVVAEYNMPVNCLYDSVDKKGLIEMYEPSATPGDIKVALANTNSSANGGDDLTGAADATVKLLAKGLQKVLCDKLDAKNAAPFNDSKYTSSGVAVEEYTKHRDFGRLALGALAHYFFGHVDATVAITNDEDFVKHMLSISAGHKDETSGGAAARYTAWDKTSVVSGSPSSWTNLSGSASDANLAMRLAYTIYQKGTSGESSVNAVSGPSDASLANIVKQVIGQDASRTMDVDGSERTKDVRQLLRFYAGDVIYVNINVKAPNVTVGTGQLYSVPTVNDQNYTIKITLGARDANL